MISANPTHRPANAPDRRLHPRLAGRLSVALAMAASLAGPARADTLESLSRAVAEGSAALTFRYRYEFVDQDGFDKDANASTLKSRLTWTSGVLSGFDFGIEADYVSVIGPEDYNSTENGKTEYPVVADPEGFDLNLAFVRYKGDAMTATGGRQRIIHGGQRFIGSVGFRQNEQTYDAVRLEFAPLEDLTLDYAYVGNVNRIFGPNDGAQPSDWRSDSHLFTASYLGLAGISLDVFGYLMDFENDNGPPNSNATFGLNVAGTIGPATVSASYATQSDYADSPLDYRTDYYAVGVTLPLEGVKLSAGYEVLGSDDGIAGFRTPLATLHKFQGWADQFLNTPADGIQDGYAGVAATFGAVSLEAVYHDFSADDGGADYGSEIDLGVTYKFSSRASVQFQIADYAADDFAADTTKAWLTLNLTL